jgi:hypothetical protein
MSGGGGLSKTRLARMHDVMAGHVERGALPGMVTVLARRGECTSTSSAPRRSATRIRCGATDRATGALVVHDDVANSQWSRPPVFPDGGAGLVS